MFLNLKNIADKEPQNIKELVNESRNIIIGAAELDSEKMFESFKELFQHIVIPSKTKNAAATQDRILYKLFDRALEFRRHLDKLQILESGLGLIILKYSQAEGLSEYRYHLFSDMAYQNIWEQMHELKRIFQYRNLNALLQIEKEIDRLMRVSHYRKKSSLRSSHIYGEGDTVLVQATYYVKEKNELNQYAKVKVKRMARVSKEAASRQVHHKLTETLKDIEGNQEFLKKLLQVAVILRDHQHPKVISQMVLEIQSLQGEYLDSSRSVALLVGEDVTVKNKNALKEIKQRYGVKESAATALKKALQAIDKQQLAEAHALVVQACYAVAFRIYQIHGIHEYNFLRGQLYFKHRHSEKYLEHLYKKSLPKLIKILEQKLNSSDTKIYMRITREIKNVIDLCFKYQRSENLKPVYEKAAQNLNRISNGFWFMYDTQKLRSLAKAYLKGIENLKISAPELKSTAQIGLFSAPLLSIQLRRVEDLFGVPHLSNDDARTAARIKNAIILLKENTLWKNETAMRVLESFSLEQLKIYQEKSRKTLIKLIREVIAAKPALY